MKLLLLFSSACACSGQQSVENGVIANQHDSAATFITQTSADSFEQGKIIEHVVCKNDASQSYALYIPAKAGNENLPIIYFFDPHADGKLPLTKYKALADKYHFILAGSNNSKNGNDWAVTENIWRILSDDTQKRLTVNTNRIYTCGFSGGAKVASYIALHFGSIKGVITGGAVLPDGTAAGNFNFSITMLSGEGDMNMTEIAATSSAFDKTSTRHRIIFFDGKHEWAPETIMDIAFAGLQLDAMRDKIIPVDAAFTASCITAGKKRLNDFISANKLMKAEQECKISISMLDGLTDEINFFKQKDAAISSSSSYKKQSEVQQNLFATEQNIKAQYQQQFQQGDINYWTKTINDLQIKSKAATPESAMYQRLLAYLSLAFYSVSNQLISNNSNHDATYFVELYKMADPTNNEAYFFSAILQARNNNAKAAETDLLKAVSLGFNDKSRMEQQPEFQRMASQIDFGKIEAGMK